jgi:hypothetical protein
MRVQYVIFVKIWNKNLEFEAGFIHLNELFILKRVCRQKQKALRDEPFTFCGRHNHIGRRDAIGFQFIHNG